MKKIIASSLLVGLLTSGCFPVETFAMDPSDFEYVGRPSLQRSVGYNPSEILDHMSTPLKISNILLQGKINTSWVPSWGNKKFIFALGGAAVLGGLWYYYRHHQPWKEGVDFEQLMKENISVPCKQFIENEIKSNFCQTASNVREKFRNIHDHIKRQKDHQTFNAETFSGNLKRLIDSLNEVEDENELSISIRGGLVNIRERANRREIKNEFFTYLCTYLSNFAKKPKYAREENSPSATFKGSIVGTSDLAHVRRQNHDHKLSEIDIYSKHTLLIDEDLIEPSINISCLAPNWFVMERKEIKLKGKNIKGKNRDLQGNSAQDVKGYKDDGKTGKDGLPGNPGKSAGHFYGRGDVFYDVPLGISNTLNIASLTIDVSGGEGGRGQNGGSGADGKEKEKGDRNKVENQKDCLISTIIIGEESTLSGSMNKIKIFFSPFANKTTKNTYESGEMGEQGGDAGKGGRGGFAGRKGSVCIENTKNEPIVPNKIEDEIDGTDGNHGIPGGGGAYCIYRGTHVLIEYPPNLYLEGAGGTALFFVSYKLLGLKEALIIPPSFFLIKRSIAWLFGKKDSHWEKNAQGEDIEMKNTPMSGEHATEYNSIGMVRHEPKPPINIKEKIRVYENFLKFGD